jgi:hypothetical protein
VPFCGCCTTPTGLVAKPLPPGVSLVSTVKLALVVLNGTVTESAAPEGPVDVRAGVEDLVAVRVDERGQQELAGPRTARGGRTLLPDDLDEDA